jgi:hypothetical protein
LIEPLGKAILLRSVCIGKPLPYYIPVTVFPQFSIDEFSSSIRVENGRVVSELFGFNI